LRSHADSQGIPPFMELEGPLLCPQEPATGTHPIPDALVCLPHVSFLSFTHIVRPLYFSLPSLRALTNT